MFVSDYKIDINNEAIDELICEYSIKLKTPRIDTETTLEFFQRLSIIAFYEPLGLKPYKDEPFFAWLEWAEKFFPHGSIAYLLYLDRTIASHSLAPDSTRGDIPVAQAPLVPSYRAPGPESPVPGPEKSPLPVPETPIMSATSRAICQSTPTALPTLGGDIGTCGVGLHTPHAGTSHNEPAVDPPDPTTIRTPIQPEEPARTHPSVESTPVLDQHVHLHDCTPCLGSPAPGCPLSGPAKSSPSQFRRLLPYPTPLGPYVSQHLPTHLS